MPLRLAELGSQRIPELCLPLALSWRLSPLPAGTPASLLAACDAVHALPTDLFSAAGGSAPYGGPQAADGTLRLYGAGFPVDPSHRLQRVLLRANKQPMVLRVVLRDGGAAAVAGPALSLHAATASYGDGGDDLVAVESDSRAAAAGGLRSLHAVLPPREEPYVLLLRHAAGAASAGGGGEGEGEDEDEEGAAGVAEAEAAAAADEAADEAAAVSSAQEAAARLEGGCDSFELEMAMRPLSAVRRELRCPEPDEDGHVSAILAKRPPTQLTVAAHGSTVLLEDNYLFTSSAMARYAQESLGGLDEGGAGRFRYRITLQLSRALDNVSIAATVGFDMLANDFALELSRGTQPPADDSPIFSWEPPLEQADALIARSSPEMGLGLGSYINFRHSLEAGPLPAGLYYLDVLEERPRPGAGLDQLEGPAGEGGQRNVAEHCHLFSLALSARAVPVGVPLIAQVVPAGARNLKVGEPLSLALHLSG